MKLLIIEDEPELNKSIHRFLEGQYHHCHTAIDFKSAMNLLMEHDYDCIILDIGLPGGSGLDILKRIKADGKEDSVIIISARSSLDDKIKGFDFGADDYLPKPFHLAELNARISAVLRRKNFDGKQIVAFNEINIDTVSRNVTVDNNRIELTRKEYDLLLYFVTNKGKVVSKVALANHLWGDEMADSYDFIYTHIKNLRKKIVEAGGEDYIRSVYALGYKFTDQ